MLNRLRFSVTKPAWGRSALICALFVIEVACIGPSVPVRVPTQTKDLSGEKRDLDFSFLKAGSTRREEVVKTLAAIDTKAHGPRYFWGRWESSSWSNTPVVAPYLGAREWGPENIVIIFDADEHVQSWRILKDKELLPELDHLGQASESALDLSSPLRLKAKLRPWEPEPWADVTLDSKEFEYNASHGFKIGRVNLERIRLTSEVLPTTDPFDKSARPQPDPSHVWVVLQFKKRTAKGKKLILGVEPPSLLLLRRYVAESKSRSAG